MADVVSFNTTISAYEKGSLWEAALQVLYSMRSAEALPDVISLCSTVSACEKASQWEAAVHLFSQMPMDRIATDVVAFNATMSACEKASRWQQACDLFAAGPGMRIEPNTVSIGAFLCALGNTASRKYPFAVSSGLLLYSILLLNSARNSAKLYSSRADLWRRSPNLKSKHRRTTNATALSQHHMQPKLVKEER